MNEYMRDQVYPYFATGEEIHISVSDDKMEDCFDFKPWTLWREISQSIYGNHSLLTFK